MEFSIVIPTYRRQNGLRELLSAIEMQAPKIDRLTEAEIIVVDNCPHSSSRKIIEHFDSTFQLVYIHEPQKGVASARNRGVGVSRGEYVIFIDDDEIPTECWLTHMFSLKNANVIVAFGPVRPIYESPPDPPCQKIADQIFTRDFHCSFGSDISEFWAALGTGNSIFKKDVCLNSTEPFDTHFNNGGEDVSLLRALVEDKGIPLTWCPGAAVWENIPAERTKEQFLKTRLFTNGQLRCRVAAQRRAPISFFSVILWMGIGLCQASYMFVMGALRSVQSPEQARYFAIKRASGLGKLLWWQQTGRNV